MSGEEIVLTVFAVIYVLVLLTSVIFIFFSIFFNIWTSGELSRLKRKLKERLRKRRAKRKSTLWLVGEGEYSWRECKPSKGIVCGYEDKSISEISPDRSINSRNMAQYYSSYDMIELVPYRRRN